MAAKKEMKETVSSLVEMVEPDDSLVDDQGSLMVPHAGRRNVLRGKRRIVDKKMFERLCRIQCEIPDILGYVGTTQEELERWCSRVYRIPLSRMMDWIRADGRVQLREAIFREVGSPSILNNIFNRYLPELASGEEEENLGLQQLIDAIRGIQPDEIRGVFADEENNAADVP